jgi:hypothetical protein
MPYTRSGPTTEILGGEIYTTWEIRETGIAAGLADFWSIPVPPHFTITLYDARIVQGPAATLQPRVLVDTSWCVAETAVAEAHPVNENDVRCTALLGTLAGYSNPNALAQEIVTRITYVGGHR